MEAGKEEALKAIEVAEKRFAQRDFAGAKNYAIKAKTLCPGLEGISQMVTTFENKCVGADGAFKLVSEAWTWLSDSALRSTYDLKRNGQLGGVTQTNLSSGHATGYSKCSNLSSSHGRHDTFWTICTSCKVQYEYLRKYVNKKLSCKNCRGTFVAVETGAAPANGSFPYCPWSYVPGNGYGSHSYDGVAYVPTTAATYFNGNGVAGYHSGHGYDYVSNVSFQWGSSGHVNQNGPTTVSTDSVYQTNGNVKRGRPKIKSVDKMHRVAAETVINTHSDVSFVYNEQQDLKMSRPDKKRKVVAADEKGSKCASESFLANGNESLGQGLKVSCGSEVQTKQCSMAPAFDARKLLIEKARTEIRKKLEEMKLASEIAAAAAVSAREKSQAEKSQAEDGQVKRETCRRTVLNASGHQVERKKIGPATITVPDSDFHDFDKDRSEECFKPKQIWALYDEEDGMPRLYCLIREIISVDPFKIHISYLSSKTDSEFGSVNWLDSGFTKSCGNFRAWNSDVVDQVNIFSHLLSKEKAGRGGCVRLYPRSGDIWAVYRNWSPDWNRSTPDEVRHQYEMVEVLDDYSEELGVCVSPLIKLAGYKTVYQRNTDKSAIRWIPRREMLRFSHQVPSWLLKGEAENLPERCWDLDPAATPDDLLHAAAAEAEAL
ncbi:hypothetical protein PIB30_003165 [Stylosanthes scabra]|uniref:DUF3444 domain-containing protein n=1 Tax=Stylosanthes scabra TaxID=79078 RepID=A0ABU6Z1Z9_9FABA|nr:hypothetical protein [Stylosanthes scabra]